jgi:hypothetical protein
MDHKMLYVAITKLWWLAKTIGMEMHSDKITTKLYRPLETYRIQEGVTWIIVEL